MTRPTRWAVVPTALVLSAVLAGCQTESSIVSTHSPAPLVTIATAEIAESEIVGQIYAEALSRADYRVRTIPLQGDSAGALRALMDGDATFTIGFTGDLMHRFDPQADASADEDVYAAALAALPDGLTAADASPATDEPVYAVSRNTSESLGLTSLSDLEGNCGGLSLGARQEVLADGTLTSTVEEAYDCTFARRQALPTDPRLVVEALRAGTVSVGVMQSADPALEGDDIVVLDDDQDAITSQQLVPVYRKGSLSEGQLRLVNRISGQLTTEDVRELVRGAEFGTASATGLANYWLDDSSS